ncbi:MAG: hypothetical protein QG597_1273 [Actinomycetota bacterium]|nr:hypothetical protein [Actinomycetota bacterium]
MESGTEVTRGHPCWRFFRRADAVMESVATWRRDFALPPFAEGRRWGSEPCCTWVDEIVWPLDAVLTP